MAELLKIFVLGELKDPTLPRLLVPSAFSSGETKSRIFPHYPLGSVFLESSVFQGPQPWTPELPASRGREAAGAEAQGHWGSSPPSLLHLLLLFSRQKRPSAVSGRPRQRTWPVWMWNSWRRCCLSCFWTSRGFHPHSSRLPACIMAQPHVHVSPVASGFRQGRGC